MNLIRNARPFPWGLGFVAAALAVILLAVSINTNFGLPFNLNLSWPPGQDYTLRAEFQDVNGLAKGATVTVAGHDVGEVVGIQAAGSHALVTMRIYRQYAPLHVGTVAAVRYSTLLAEKYVELQPAPDWKPALTANAIVGVDETVTPVDFDQFLSSFDPQTRARLQTLIQETGGGLDGQQENINDLLSQLHSLSMESRAGLSTLHAHNADLDQIILDLAITSQQLASDRAQLGDFVQQAAAVNGTIASQSTALAQFITQLTFVMSEFDATLVGNEGNLHATVVELDPTLAQLNGLVAQTYAYDSAYRGELNSSAAVLIPFIGSAISQQDGNGNYLRQYLACVQNQESTKNHFDYSCGSSAPASPAPASSPKGKHHPSGINLPGQICGADANGAPIVCPSPSSPLPGGLPSPGSSPSPSPSPSPLPSLNPGWLVSPSPSGGLP